MTKFGPGWGHVVPALLGATLAALAGGAGFLSAWPPRASARHSGAAGGLLADGTGLCENGRTRTASVSILTEGPEARNK